MIFFILNLFLPRWFHTFSTYFFFKKTAFSSTCDGIFSKKNPSLCCHGKQPNLPSCCDSIAGGRCEDSEPRRGRLGGGAVPTRGALWLRLVGRPRPQAVSPFHRKIPGQSSRVPRKGRFFPPKKRGEGKMVFG